MNGCSHHQKLFSNWSCFLPTIRSRRFWAILLQDILNITWLPFLSLSWIFSLIRIPLSGRPEYRLRTHPTMPPYSSAQKQAITQFIAFTQAKDALAAKVLISRSLASFWLRFACCRPNLMSRETMADTGLGYSFLKRQDGMLKRLSMREWPPFLFCFEHLGYVAFLCWGPCSLFSSWMAFGWLFCLSFVSGILGDKIAWCLSCDLWIIFWLDSVVVKLYGLSYTLSTINYGRIFIQRCSYQ